MSRYVRALVSDWCEADMKSAFVQFAVTFVDYLQPRKIHGWESIQNLTAMRKWLSERGVVEELLVRAASLDQSNSF